MTMHLRNDPVEAVAGRRYRPRRRESTLDFSDITEKDTDSLWNRSVSGKQERHAYDRYRKKLHHRFDKGGRSSDQLMSGNWEMVNRIVNSPGKGDEEALPYLKALCSEDAASLYEATHTQDTAPPFWTLLHKFAFYGASFILVTH